MTKIEEIVRLARRLHAAKIETKNLAYVVSNEEWCQIVQEFKPRDLSYLSAIRIQGLLVVQTDGVQILNGEL